MPAFCSVVGCSKRAERDRSRYFRIPKALQNRGEMLDALSKERRERWVRALKRGNLSDTFLKNARICEDHFISGEPAKLEDRDSPDWVPSVKMGYISIKTQDEQSVKRHVRLVERQMKRPKMDKVDEAGNMEPKAGPSTEAVAGPSTEAVACPFTEAVAGPSTEAVAGPSTETPEMCKEYESRRTANIQTDLDMDHLNKLFGDLDFCNQKIYALEEKLKASDLTEESFKNDSKTLYFTGFPKAEMMFTVFNSVAPYLSTKSALSPFRQFILTLMKLRLNLPFKYLSYRFAIAPSTASESFYKCIDVLYARYHKLIFWPDREILQKNMPACFIENFGDRIAVIIDCFEIYTETPSGMLNAARCWSNYKHHETVKFLIGNTPQGTVSYISEGWGGRTSDKFLTENCGFLNLIVPGDVILADRGFLIRDSVETLRGHLEIPAFTKGKNQLDPADIESTRKIANVRIHVERIIGLLKRKFKICQGPIPISMLSAARDDLSVLDKILVVCSVFLNFCPSVIPMD